MAGDLADQAYGHCLAVLGEPGSAAEAALAAFRRAGRSKASVLAQARYQALLRSDDIELPGPDTPVPDDLGELALLLAAMRPPVERALVDLRSRLDRGGLGRALGLPAATATTRTDLAVEMWDRELDPMLMASLGPGDCADLAAILAGAPAANTTLSDLGGAGAAVTAHLEGCEVCTDRRRAMVSVRTLLGQGETEAPDGVREAARRSRRMRPAAAPPSLEPRGRRPLVAVAVAAGVILALVGAGVATAAVRSRNDARDRRVASLVRLKPAGTLLLAVSTGGLNITNGSKRTIRWQATSEAPWLVFRPASGTLAPGQAAALTARVLPTSPEGLLRAMVTVTASDGSAAARAYETVVERAPDLAATLVGCTVTATAEDPSSIAAAVLHWSDGSQPHEAPMTDSDVGYRAALPTSPALSWWVSATDARGNSAQTAEAKAAPTNC